VLLVVKCKRSRWNGHVIIMGKTRNGDNFGGETFQDTSISETNSKMRGKN
jgi:hypothetical protein